MFLIASVPIVIVCNPGGGGGASVWLPRPDDIDFVPMDTLELPC